MAGVQHRDAAGEVDVLLALGIPQGRVFRPHGVKVTHHADAARGGQRTTRIQISVFHLRLDRQMECRMHGAMWRPPWDAVQLLFNAKMAPFRGTTFTKQVEPIEVHCRRFVAPAPGGRGRGPDEPASLPRHPRGHPRWRHRGRHAPARHARPGGRAGHRAQHRGARLQPAAGRGLHAQPPGQRHLRHRVAA
ncbi:Uncharacterised protein [Bordetella pertussis]|nr:Uncharacterised protein [Bordetella pertussis]